MLSDYGYALTDKKPHEAWAGTDYLILHDDSGTGTFARDNSQATLSYLCEYNFVDRFVVAVLGKTTASGGTLARVLPEPHPYFDNFYAASCDVAPVGQSANYPAGPVWRKAKVTVAYRPATYLIAADGVAAAEYGRFTSVTTEANVEMLTTGLGTMQLVNPARPLPDNPPSFATNSVRKSYTWHSVPAYSSDFTTPVMEATVLSLAGTTNSLAFDGYAPGTCLFLGFSPRQVLPNVATSGSYYWDVTYLFSIRDNGDSPVVSGERLGWDYIYDPLRSGGPGFNLVTTTGTVSGQRLYRRADHNLLFQYA